MTDNQAMFVKGVEMILCGYNTPIHYVPDPSQDILQGFHNSLVMQSGAYQNGTWVVAVAKAGTEEGVEQIGNSIIVAPSGEIVGACTTLGDVTPQVRLKNVDHFIPPPPPLDPPASTSQHR